jgi:hypothetical protein
MNRGRFALLVGVAWILLCSQTLDGAHAFTTVPFVVHSIPKGLTTYNLDGRKRQRRLFSTVSPPERARQKVATNEEHVPTTMSVAIHRFFLGPDHGPVCVLGMLALLSAWRLAFPVTLLDSVAFAGMAVFWWIQEYVFHGKLLHSCKEWMGKEIHAAHHAKPYFHISIDPAYLMVGWLVGAHMLLRLALPLPFALSATLGYVSAGLFYEWAHYIVHTRVKPPNAFWKRVRDNHIKHHLVDDRYWLSFTIPFVDDLFGTNPQVEDVKRERARTVEEERENGWEPPAIGTDVARSIPK